MQKMVQLLLTDRLLPHTARLVLALLGPVLRSLTLTPDEVKQLLQYVGGGLTPPAFPPYTAGEISEVVQTVRVLVAEAAGAQFGVVLSEADLKALFTAVAGRMA